MLTSRTILLFFLLSIFGLSNAQTTAFYVGGTLQNGHVDIKSTATGRLSSSTPKIITSTLSLNTIGFGPIIGLYHQFSQSQWGIDTSLSFTYHWGENKQAVQRWFISQNSSLTVSTPFSTQFIAAARFQWQPKLALLIGPEMNYITFKSTSGATAGNQGVTGKHESQQLGFGLAYGVDYQLNSKWHIRLLDSRVYYSAFSWEGTEPLTEQQVRAKYRLADNTLQLSALVTL